MIDYKKFTLDNGLQVIVHEDPSVQIAVLNLLYNVGSKDESPDKTGFAHLFEHLMFGGSINVPDFDGELQKIGGENNAFTSPDITNYYMTVPYQNIEGAFWLESDRMLGLPFSTKVLEVQRQVVIEEFKQRYLNQPYGDVWLKLRPLAYHVHPYQWATIGKEISHIADATMEDVKAFYQKYYTPNNAVLVIAGNITFDQVKSLSEKWFGPIPAAPQWARSLSKEPQQTEPRSLELFAPVPNDALYMAFHMPGKFDEGYYEADLLSDILGRGKSSRLYQQLVKKQNLFSTLGAYVTGSVEPGLLVIHGRLMDNADMKVAEQAVWNIITQLISDRLMDDELLKVKNQAESTLVFDEVEVLNRAMNLAFATLSGDTAWVNQEQERINQVTEAGIIKMAGEILRPDNCSTIYYYSQK